MAESHPHRRDRPHHRLPRPPSRLRREGKVPGVVYGHGHRPGRRSSVDWRELRQRAHHRGRAQRPASTSSVDGDDAARRIVKRDPAPPGAPRRRSTSTSCWSSRDEAIAVEVPIVLDGEAEEVDQRGRHRRAACSFTLTVQAKPADIPNEHRGRHHRTSTIGDPIRVGDLALPAGVTTERRPRRGRRRRVSSPPASSEARGRGGRGRAAAEAGRGGEAAEGEAAEGGDGGGRGRRRQRRGRRRGLTAAASPARAGDGHARPTCSSSASATRAPSTTAPATTSAPRSSTLLADRHGGRAASGQGAGAGRRGAHRRQARGARRSPDLHERLGPGGRRRSSGATASTTRTGWWSSTTSSTCRVGRLKVKVGGGLAGHNGLRRSRPTCTPTTSSGSASASASRRAAEQGADHVLAGRASASGPSSTSPSRRRPTPSS